MSKYDEERKKLGIISGESSTISKYDSERSQIGLKPVDPNFNQRQAEQAKEITTAFKEGLPKIGEYFKGIGESFKRGVEERKAHNEQQSANTAKDFVSSLPMSRLQQPKEEMPLQMPSERLFPDPMSTYRKSFPKLEAPSDFIQAQSAVREYQANPTQDNLANIQSSPYATLTDQQREILEQNLLQEQEDSTRRQKEVENAFRYGLGDTMKPWAQDAMSGITNFPLNALNTAALELPDTLIRNTFGQGITDIGAEKNPTGVMAGKLAGEVIGGLKFAKMLDRSPVTKRVSDATNQLLINQGIGSPRAARYAAEGLVGEGAFSASKEIADVVLDTRQDGDQSLPNRLSRVATEAAIGGAAGAGLGVAENAVRGILNRQPDLTRTNNVPRATETASGTFLRSNGTNTLPDGSLATRDNRSLLKKVEDKPANESSTSKQSWNERLFGSQGVGITAGSKNPKEMIDTHIVSRPRELGSMYDRVSDVASKANQELVDRFAPFKLVSKDAYDAAMDSTRANNLANITIDDKFVDLEGNVLGKSLKEVFSPVPRGQRHIADRYIIMRDAVDRMDRGLRVYGDEPWFPQTSEEAAVLVSELESRYPWLKSFGQNWNEFIRNRENLWVDSGIASPELINALRSSNPNYAPMFRQQDKASLKSRLASNSYRSGFSGQKAPVKRAKGSSRKIIEPARGMIETTGASYHAMLRNRAMMNIYEAIQADPNRFKGIIEIVDETAEMKKSTLDQINKLLDEEGPEGIASMLNDEITNIFKKAKQSSKEGDAIVTVMVRGEPVKMRVYEPSLLKAIEGISPEQLGAITRVFNTLSRGIKYAATGGLAPLQGARLAFRDLPIAFAQSRDKKRFLLDISHALVSQIGDWLPDFVPGSQRLGNLARQYYRAGGGYEAYLKGDSRLHRISADLTKDPILSGRNMLKTIRKVNPFRALKAFGDALENIPRIAAFSAEMRKNGWKRDPESVRRALEAGREATVNWSRRGAKGAEIESFLPYSNAAVQGTYRLFKRFKEQPVSAIALIMGIAGAKIASYEQFKNDPDYQHRSKYEKGIVVDKTKDGKFVTIPVEPTEAFIADQLLNFYKWATDGERLPNVKENIQEGADAFLPKYLSGPVSLFTSPGKSFDAKSGLSNLTGGSAFEPVNSLVTGKNFFGADIVPREYQGLPTEEQFNETTSAAGRWAAENLGIDAFTFDYLAEKFGGDLAKVGLPMTSEVGEGDPFGNIVDEALTRLKLLEDPVMKNKIANDFYEYLNSVTQAKEANSRKDKPLPSWYQQAYDEVTSYKKGSLNSRISELNSIKKDIQFDTSLSAKDRSEQLREIQNQLNLLRIQGIKRLEELGVPKTKG